MLALDHSLLIACAGAVALPPSVTRDGSLVEVGYDGVVRRRVPVGRSPGGLALVGNDVWIGRNAIVLPSKPGRDARGIEIAVRY